MDPMLTRRDLLFSAAAGELFKQTKAEPLKPIVISVNALLDRGAHSGMGLGEGEIAVFQRYQERARREYAVSGIRFDVRVIEGAYLRTQGYSEIPAKFLERKVINLFVTDTLAYDVDRDRSGGCSSGRPFFKIFLGLRDAGETTLRHEYAHHFTLDTLKNPTVANNVWADFRNEYWLWRQSHGVPILEFRACAHMEWAEE
jgi:hypothetical protein